jgi:excisionase family DNA binding protein
MESEYFKVEEVADLLGIADSTVRRWMRRPIDPLPHVKYGTHNSTIRIGKKTLMEFVDRHAVGGSRQEAPTKA